MKGSISRRRFIEDAAIAVAAASSFPFILTRRARASWAGGTVIHPNIHNLRVVGITDKNMTRGHHPNASWSRQDELVNDELVWENMDKLACALAQTRNPREAWEGIFLKSPVKSWRDTVAAIKTNHISRQHTRSAVMAKICHTLTDLIGLKPANIHIYDGTHGGSMIKETPFAGLPEGIRIEGKWGGVSTETDVPEPWNNRSVCLSHLVTGAVDILINIALCKGHSDRFGGFTMTMKNHFGTFSPRPGHRNGRLEYLIAINRTPEILGPMDRRTGTVLFPRQQLCLIDALWASRSGPGGNPSHQTNFLAMGVTSPVVDYLVATRFRGQRMGWKPNMNVTGQFLSAFGYREDDLPEGGDIIEVS